MSVSDAAPPLGRRDRGMQDKRRRIFEAASSLFEQLGFEAVTTHAIAERADIAVGTLFRYAASKTDLLLMVYNERLRAAVTSGEALARDEAGLHQAIVAMIAPLLDLGRASAEIGKVYQRELLFGSSGDSYRLEGLELIAGLEASIARRLLDETRERGLPLDIDAARLASSSIFAVTHLVVSRTSTGAHPGFDPLDDLERQVDQIITGYFATRSAGGPA